MGPLYRLGKIIQIQGTRKRERIGKHGCLPGLERINKENIKGHHKQYDYEPHHNI